MESFFGAGPPVKSQVIVGKVAAKVPPKPQSQTTPSSSSSSAHRHKSSSSHTHSSKTNGHSHKNSSNGTPSVKRPKELTKHSRKESYRSDRSSSVLSKKRASREPTRVTSASPSGSDSGSDLDDLFGEVISKKPKLSSNSRDTSKTPIGNGVGVDEDVGTGKRKQFCLSNVDERGEWGRGWAGYVPCEEVVRGQRRGFAGSSIMAKKGDEKGLAMYTAYFPQDGFSVDDLPSVDLTYPSGCTEKFILLAAKAREYAPIMELRNALRLILEYYIPPSHRHIFGTLSNSFGNIDITPVATPQPTTINQSPLDSAAQVPSSLPNANGDESAKKSNGEASGSNGAADSQIPSVAGTEASAQPEEPIGSAIRRALASNRRDGPSFLRAMERYNTAMADLINTGAMSKWLDTRVRLDADQWSDLVDGVHDEAYSRIVGPYANELEHHPTHPNEVARAITDKEDSYGELRHRFMSKIIEQTGLSANSVFVDLGSGVGNCVMQTALQAGCPSYGFELLPVPAHCARLQLREVQRRWAMWGLNGDLNVEVHEGDFRIHSEVSKRLRQADVVLVNNEVFPPSLNVDLTHMFLDLKDGAVIVSLKPLVNQSFRMNDTNCDTFDAIVKLSQHTYYKDWVSWKGESGEYYLQVIDRSMRRKFEEELQGRRRRG